ncbi:unnamed protein product [Sordaria macrospora k-hell]|uniref:WGS project CABT00000000 data, contig 2.100 n=2 Tax=Sordaria macrospora TaxID=5147 RepID=F7WC80_SORMK|nr:uncharacterized protein SMAC_09560 [Sordaria macrospora k-hell]KAH7629305.1 hypothetical protein B0T09DRAFT_287578 [Sordaria sp. MPI-SDFR-AT-0083]CCC14562.1 unnamed protein product [Sordaria macrospora k-hell]
MPGYRRRTGRKTGSFPEFWPDEHDVPVNLVSTYNAFMRKPELLPGEEVQIVDYTHLNSESPGKRSKVRIDWINYTWHREVVPIRKGEVEDIVRAEADSLGLKYVGIRQGPHNTESVYENGFPTMIWDPRTGRTRKQQRKADWHITLVMGHSINEIVLHGHMFINWDGLADTPITIVTNPKPKTEGGEREFLHGGPEVCKQYWGTVRGSTLPLKGVAEAAPEAPTT